MMFWNFISMCFIYFLFLHQTKSTWVTRKCTSYLCITRIHWRAVLYPFCNSLNPRKVEGNLRVCKDWRMHSFIMDNLSSWKQVQATKNTCVTFIMQNVILYLKMYSLTIDNVYTYTETIQKYQQVYNIFDAKIRPWSFKAGYRIWGCNGENMRSFFFKTKCILLCKLHVVYKFITNL